MHFYVLNKYTDMKSTWLLCFYAFIAQKSFTTMNLSRPDAQLTVSIINISWIFLFTFFNVSDQI